MVSGNKIKPTKLSSPMEGTNIGVFRLTLSVLRL